MKQQGWHTTRVYLFIQVWVIRAGFWDLMVLYGFYASNFEKVGRILISACMYVCMYVCMHVWDMEISS